MYLRIRNKRAFNYSLATIGTSVTAVGGMKLLGISFHRLLFFTDTNIELQNIVIILFSIVLAVVHFNIEINYHEKQMEYVKNTFDMNSDDHQKIEMRNKNRKVNIVEIITLTVLHLLISLVFFADILSLQFGLVIFGAFVSYGKQFYEYYSTLLKYSDNK